MAQLRAACVSAARPSIAGGTHGRLSRSGCWISCPTFYRPRWPKRIRLRRNCTTYRLCRPSRRARCRVPVPGASAGLRTCGSELLSPRSSTFNIFGAMACQMGDQFFVEDGANRSPTSEALVLSLRQRKATYSRSHGFDSRSLLIYVHLRCGSEQTSAKF
jgi:hypothetical protein